MAIDSSTIKADGTTNDGIQPSPSRPIAMEVPRSFGARAQCRFCGDVNTIDAHAVQLAYLFCHGTGMQPLD